jgi:hypothetical protein
MMKSTNDKNMIDENKKRYEKPLLRVIDLEADQVLGAGCKLDSGGLAPGSTPCVANYCSQAGS